MTIRRILHILGIGATFLCALLVGGALVSVLSFIYHFGG